MAGARRGLSVLIGASLLGLTALPAPAAAGFSAFQYEIGPVPIPDGHGSARIGFDFIAPPGASITDARPNFRVNHRRTRQLKLFVKGPDGTKVLLSDHETRGRKLGQDPCAPDPNDLAFTGFWDSGAKGPIGEGSPPYTGYFVPHDPLSVYDGTSYGGHWQVIVRDTEPGKRGRLLCGAMSIFYITS